MTVFAEAGGERLAFMCVFVCTQPSPSQDQAASEGVHLVGSSAAKAGPQQKGRAGEARFLPLSLNTSLTLRQKCYLRDRLAVTGAPLYNRVEANVTHLEKCVCGRTM